MGRIAMFACDSDDGIALVPKMKLMASQLQHDGYKVIANNAVSASMLEIICWNSNVDKHPWENTSNRFYLSNNRPHGYPWAEYHVTVDDVVETPRAPF